MHLFVYGTLCRGLSRNKILRGCEYLGLAMGRGSLIDLGNYPAMLQGKGNVIGEVYRIESEELFAVLDDMEGYRQGDEANSLYLRRKTQVRLFATGDGLTADVYLYNRPAGARTLIAQGDYRRYLLDKDSKKPYYIAYGSNLSIIRFKDRVGELKEALRGCIPGYCLTYNKKPSGSNAGAYANIAAGLAGPDCPCVAYRVTQEQLEALDRHEGAPGNYIRTALPMITRTGDEIMGYTYVAHPDKLVAGKKPEASYRQHLLQGYSDHGLGELAEHEC